MQFAKYHALGNDYLVLPPGDRPLTPALVRRVCQRHHGVGADGVLWGPLPAGAGPAADFGLRIFNPDGSEAEKSGNGLRIFASYLWDAGLVGVAAFTVAIPAGVVTCQVFGPGREVQVQMGQVSFHSQAMPMSGPPREVLREVIRPGEGMAFTYCAASLGNPHCVILHEQPSAAVARQYGPLIEQDPRFLRRTNVQFMQVLDWHNLQIEIWERGAGYTLASGSSATAAAAVAYRLGLCAPAVTVHMPGGTLQVQLTADFQATLTGPVAKICAGQLAPELLAA
ncbi:MAG: diaminopimelate epimerase [Anaerolineales bacterium]|nr:diaminopimelate epimerase [Anaerolineales bacterium]